MYKIKEIYYTLQGEGFHTGRAAVFCRFSGCNLWSGREQDRATAICKFCDTEFWGTDGVNGGKYSAPELVIKCKEIWNAQGVTNPFIVFTGGEPALQLDKELINEFHSHNFEIAIETNGTIELAENIDWICMSPKANTEILVSSGEEIKIVYPQVGIDPLDFEKFDFNHFYIQPMDNENKEHNTLAAIDFCKMHPKWKLSIQTHKLLQIP